MTEAESNKVIAEYVKLQKLMAVARRRMMDGDRISLATITKRTKRFCDHVTSLIPEERIRFSDRLGSLVTVASQSSTYCRSTANDGWSCSAAMMSNIW